ncbi:SusC/RagA family TonB-linked outer membrane protein [Flavivirga abyssicola]|uniref:SusC/RagA family TonB-linked outer membrane protein n=1 Tax=Flavivirga abyssicola TaxID=3063533 RepID=UPI0026DF789F|nr:SusC/RagA family TonB-linked outer membrane protein [Flavivirga sp. MEBiC07777]WVK12738.1 SusC/RagA family TonB-linked outer membrane protein [Flavivirga sp. MEBiC07777]
MKIYIFLLCATVFGLAPMKTLSQEKVVISSEMTVTVDEVFSLIRKQTDFKFIYKKGLFKDTPKINLKKGKIKVTSLLNNSLKGNKNIDVIVTSNNTILIKERKKNNQQGQKITGKVTDQSGVSIAGVTVFVKGTNKGAVSDFDGKYTIVVPDSQNILVFSYLGFKKQEILVGSQTVIDVVMIEDISTLNEVVVNAGYYSVKEREKTGSISKIEAKDIDKQPTNNIIVSLQGLAPGVDISQSSGLNDGGVNIVIRGVNSINRLGNQSSPGTSPPLFIVDGVPFDGESLSNINVNFERFGNVSPLNSINPADIASIEILKDADATAIYGSRGANGVVLITTKQAKAGKTQFRVNSSVTFSRISLFKDLLNTEQYLEMRREIFSNSNLAPTDPNVPNGLRTFDIDGTWDQNRYTDWQKVLVGGTAIRQNSQLSVSGGSEQTKFLISGTYLNETTVFPSDKGYTRLALQSNINHQSKDKRFSINLTANFNVNDNDIPGNNFYIQSLRLAPNAPALYDDEGNLNWEPDENGLNTWNNPLAQLNEIYNSITTTTLINANISYKLTNNLKLSSRFGYTDLIFDEYRAEPFTKLRFPDLFPSSVQSEFYINNSRRKSWIVEPQINWDLVFGDLDLKFLVGGTLQKRTTDSFAELREGFPSDDLIFSRLAAATLTPLNQVEEEYKFNSVFGRINLNYQGKYILNFTGRRDGSSRFGPGKQFGNFGAIGMAWIFSKENLLVDSSVLSFGKLRASIGVTGSDNIGQLQFLDTYEATSFEYNVLGAISTTKLPNPNLQWESNDKVELALETGFFNDRIFLTTAWYRNRSGNQLVTEPLSEVTGFRNFRRNLDAVVENSGFEIDLTTRNIETKDFSWKTIFNYSRQRNELVSFPDIENTPFARNLVVGESLNVQRVYNYLGVNPDTGAYEFTDIDGDGRISRNDDREFLVDLTPDFFGGFGNNFRYKNWQLNFFFQFKKQLGRSVQTEDLRPLGGMENVSVEFLNRWQQPGDITDFQKLWLTNRGGIPVTDFRNGAFAFSSSNAAYTDASYIRLRTASLAYNLPKNILKGIDLNMYLQGQNLFIITDFDHADPETGLSAFPLLRQITLGFNLTF